MFRVALDSLQQVFLRPLEVAPERIRAGGIVIVEVELLLTLAQHLLWQAGLTLGLEEFFGEPENFFVGFDGPGVITNTIIEVGEFNIGAESNQAALVVSKPGISRQLIVDSRGVTEDSKNDAQLAAKIRVEEEVPVELADPGQEALVSDIRQCTAAAVADGIG